MTDYITKDQATQIAEKYHADIACERYIAISPEGLYKLCNEVIQKYINSLDDDVELPNPAGHFSFMESAHKSFGAEFYSADQMREVIQNYIILMASKKDESPKNIA